LEETENLDGGEGGETEDKEPITVNLHMEGAKKKSLTFTRGADNQITGAEVSE